MLFNVSDYAAADPETGFFHILYGCCKTELMELLRSFQRNLDWKKVIPEAILNSENIFSSFDKVMCEYVRPS
jgi:hypothetical protein